MSSIICQIPIGEAIDKYSILLIKYDLCEDYVQRENIEKELHAVHVAIQESVGFSSCDHFISKMKNTNEIIWNFVGRLGIKTDAGEFDEEYITTARAIYEFNNKRYFLKREINDHFESDLKEEKIF